MSAEAVAITTATPDPTMAREQTTSAPFTIRAVSKGRNVSFAPSVAASSTLIDAASRARDESQAIATQTMTLGLVDFLQ